MAQWLKKKSACKCRRLGFNPWVGKILWSRKWQPTPVFLPGESHEQRSLAGCSPWDHKESDRWVTEHAHTTYNKLHILKLYMLINSDIPKTITTIKIVNISITPQRFPKSTSSLLSLPFPLYWQSLICLSPWCVFSKILYKWHPLVSTLTWFLSFNIIEVIHVAWIHSSFLNTTMYWSIDLLMDICVVSSFWLLQIKL